MKLPLLSSVLMVLCGLHHQPRILYVHGSVNQHYCFDEESCVYEFQSTCTQAMYHNDIFGDECCALQDNATSGTCTVTAIGGRCSVHSRPGRSCFAASASAAGQPYSCLPGHVVEIKTIFQNEQNKTVVTIAECPQSPYDPLARPQSILDEFPHATLRLEGVNGIMSESSAAFFLDATKNHILSYYNQSDSVRELIIDMSLYPMTTMVDDNMTTVSYLLLASYRGASGAFQLQDPFLGDAVVAPYLAALKAAGGLFFSSLTGINNTIEPAAFHAWTFLQLEGLMGLFPVSTHLTTWTEATKNHILSFYEESDTVIDLMIDIELQRFDTTADNTTTVSFEVFGSYRGSKTAFEVNDPFMDDAVGPYLTVLKELGGPFFSTLTGISFDSTTATPPFAASTTTPTTVPMTKPTATTAGPVDDAAIMDNTSSSSPAHVIKLPGAVAHVLMLPIGLLLLWQQLL